MFPSVYLHSLDSEITELRLRTPFSKELYKLSKKTVPLKDTIIPFSLFVKLSKYSMSGHRLVIYG